MGKLHEGLVGTKAIGGADPRRDVPVNLNHEDAERVHVAEGCCFASGGNLRSTVKGSPSVEARNVGL